MGGDKAPEEPIIFLKPHTSIFPCFINQIEQYQLPLTGNEIHHEIELGVMIGR